MAMDHVNEDVPSKTDCDREWRVARCAHGCVHLTFDRVTLTLTQGEFHALRNLLRQASQRWRQELPSEMGGRAH